VADYRGYGASDGMPTFTATIEDACPVFEGFELPTRAAADNVTVVDPAVDLFGRGNQFVPSCEMEIRASNDVIPATLVKVKSTST